MEDAKDAADAVRDLDGRPMTGRESGSIFSVKVSYAQTQKAVEYEQPTASSRHGHRRSMSPLRRPLSPQAEEWYSSYKKPEPRSRMVDDRESSNKRSRSPIRRRRDASPRMSDLDFGRRSSQETSKRPAEYGHRSRSRSPLREPHKRRRSLTPSQGSSRKRELPNLDAMDEVEEVEDAPIFKLLDHKTELENMALTLSLDINIRPFDGSVAFGGAITNDVSGRVVKLEPSTSGGIGQKPTMEKWMVFADRGQAIHVSSYQQNTLVKEHFVPKFEWEPFSAAIKGMCEKFLLGK